MTNIIRTSRVDKFDHISISDKVPFSETQDFSGLLLPHYKLVRSFRPPPGTLNVIEAISIADAVASAIREYSSLHYMSFWFANMMYLATKSYINFDGVENKSTSGLAAAGKFKGFKLVDPDTGDINLEHWSKNERGLEDLYERFYTPGFSTKPPEDLDALLRLVSKDKELLGREGASEPLGVPSIVAAAQVNQNELSEFFLNKYQAARDRRVCLLLHNISRHTLMIINRSANTTPKNTFLVALFGFSMSVRRNEAGSCVLSFFL